MRGWSLAVAVALSVMVRGCISNSGVRHAGAGPASFRGERRKSGCLPGGWGEGSAATHGGPGSGEVGSDLCSGGLLGMGVRAWGARGAERHGSHPRDLRLRGGLSGVQLQPSNSGKMVMRSRSAIEREAMEKNNLMGTMGDFPRIDDSLIDKGSSLNDYEIDFGDAGVLGTGTYSTVRVAVHKETGRKLAVKAIDLLSAEPDTIIRLQREIQVLRALKHPNIIDLFEVILEGDKLYMIMELCTGGELWHFLQEVKIMPNGEKYFKSKNRGMVLLTEAKVASLVRGIVEAINFCHERNVCHRDLKLENLMMDHKGEDATIKLIDFGFSKIFNSTDGFYAVLGSPYYVAHEVLVLNQNRTTGYGPACDMWSVGVITYMLLCGQAPFDGKNDLERLEAVRRGTFTFPRHIRLSAHAVGFVAGLLFLDPDRRLTAKQALNHPWLADVEPSGRKSDIGCRKSTLSWLLCGRGG